MNKPDLLPYGRRMRRRIARFERRLDDQLSMRRLLLERARQEEVAAAHAVRFDSGQRVRSIGLGIATCFLAIAPSIAAEVYRSLAIAVLLSVAFWCSRWPSPMLKLRGLAGRPGIERRLSAGDTNARCSSSRDRSPPSGITSIEFSTSIRAEVRRTRVPPIRRALSAPHAAHLSTASETATISALGTSHAVR